MSRRKRNAEEIQKPENYFNRYIALEIQKDWARDRQYYDRYVSLDALLEGKKMGNHKYRVLPACNLGGEDYEAHIVESDVFGWIESIEHPGLLEAILQLPAKDKLLLTLRFQYCLSQAEIAQAMGLTQGTVSWREGQLIKKIRIFLKTFNKKT